MLPSLVFAWTCIRACAELQPTWGTERERASELASHSYYVTPMTSSIQILQHLRVRGCWYRVALDGDDVTTQHRTQRVHLHLDRSICLDAYWAHRARFCLKLSVFVCEAVITVVVVTAVAAAVSVVVDDPFYFPWRCYDWCCFLSRLCATHARTHTSTIRSSIVQLLCNVASRYTGL